MTETPNEQYHKNCVVMLETVHHAQVEFLFNRDITFGRGKYNSNDKWIVIDKMKDKIEALCKKYPSVMNDSQYCTQADGYLFKSPDINELHLFVKEFSRYLGRFNCIHAI